MNKMVKKIISTIVLGGVLMTPVSTVGAVENGTFTAKNKYETYGYNPLWSVKVNDQIDFVRMPEHPHQYDGMKANLKYIVIHETAVTKDGAVAANYYASFINNYNSRGIQASSKFVVDDKSIFQLMDIEAVEWAIGAADPSKSDISDFTSASIEMCVNADGDYGKTVANTIFLVRKILEKYPDLKLKQHADAYSEWSEDGLTSFQKNCPTILRSGNAWWNWEKFVYFATNKDKPIPFLDFDPTDVSQIPADKELRDILGEVELAVMINNKAVADEVAAAKTIDLDEEEIENVDDVIYNYTPLDIKSSLNQIVNASGSNLYYSKEDVSKILGIIDTYSAIEGFNPNIVVQFMNSYTGYLRYSGKVKGESFNFTGLKNKSGEFINYDSMEEGILASIQYLKAYTGNKKMKIKNTNNDALNTIGFFYKKVKEFDDYSKALGVSEEFVSGIKARVIELL